jgi:hypothetical protein
LTAIVTKWICNYARPPAKNASLFVGSQTTPQRIFCHDKRNILSVVGHHGRRSNAPKPYTNSAAAKQSYRSGDSRTHSDPDDLYGAK